MTNCPFCHEDKENVVPREMKVPSTSFTAKSKQPMCDECFNKVTGAFQRQEATVEITKES